MAYKITYDRAGEPVEILVDDADFADNKLTSLAVGTIKYLAGYTAAKQLGSDGQWHAMWGVDSE